jgi:hypothetical protein
LRVMDISVGRASAHVGAGKLGRKVAEQSSRPLV